MIVGGRVLASFPREAAGTWENISGLDAEQSKPPCSTAFPRAGLVQVPIIAIAAYAIESIRTTEHITAKARLGICVLGVA